MNEIAIVMGSKSDFEVCREAIDIIKSFNVSVKVEVISAHRTPQRLQQFGLEADNKYDVIIAAAGGSAHLPGMVAAYTSVPVIGLPIKSRTLNGVDSLLSIVQMPAGVPVATVAINGGKNAGLLALQIIGVHNQSVRMKLIDFKLKMENDVIVNHNEAICK